MLDVDRLREDFPVLKRRRYGKPIVYLDNAATSLKPIQVISAVVDYYERHCANIHRGVHVLSQEASELYERAHDEVARFIGARDREELVFVKNTTEAINIVAYGLDWRPGDEVITTVMEHHSNIVPWQLIRDRFGVRMRVVGIRADFSLDLDHLERLIGDRTRLVTVTHVSNVLGTINPVREICRIAHDHGALCLVDAAQSAPHMPLNVRDMGVDFLAFSVTGDTPLLALLDGKVALLPIKEVVEIVKGGGKPRVLSLDGEGKLSFEEVTGWLTHRERVYDIRYEGSAIPLRATRYHSVFVWEGGCIVPKRVEDLKPGSYLITFGAGRLSILPPVKEVTFTYVHHGNHVTERIAITKDLARLIGYYLAGGSLRRAEHRVQFTFGDHEGECIEDCKRIIEGLEGTTFYADAFRRVQELRECPLSEISRRTGSCRKTVKKYSKPPENPSASCLEARRMKARTFSVKGRTNVSFRSKKWFEFFRRFCGTKRGKHLPSFSWSLPQEHVHELLRGYLRGDGSKTKGYDVRARSVAKQLIVELCWLLKLRGISCTVLDYGDRMYELVIQRSGLTDLEFGAERGKEDAPRDKTLPVDGLRAVYKALEPKENTRIRSIVRKGRKRATRKGIREVIRWVEETHKRPIDPTCAKILGIYKAMLDGDIGTVKVRSVREAGEEEVYDLSVPNGQRFFGGVYPVLLHNSAHKMLGPTGVGALYVRGGLGDRLCPTMGGGDMIERVTLERSTWNRMPWKFEAGTPHIAGGIGFGEAVDYLRRIGMEAVREHEKGLTSYAIERMRDIGNLTLFGPDDVGKRGGVVTFVVHGINPHDVAMYLDETENIAVRSGLHCAEPLHSRLGLSGSVRASFYIYNTKEEVDIFCDVLERIARELA